MKLCPDTVSSEEKCLQDIEVQLMLKCFRNVNIAHLWLVSQFFSWRRDKTTHEELNIVYKFVTVLDISALYMSPFTSSVASVTKALRQIIHFYN